MDLLFDLTGRFHSDLRDFGDLDKGSEQSMIGSF